MDNVKLIPLSSENFETIVREHRPPLPDIEALKRHERVSTTETRLHRIGAITTDDKLVGFAMAVLGPWDPILKPGYVDVVVQVDRDWRRKGLGSMLYGEVRQFAVRNGGVVLQSSVRDNQPDDLKWAQKRGFVQTVHTFESYLDVTRFDEKRHAHIVYQCEKGGIRFTPFAEYPQNDTYLARFFDFWWELVTDVPGMEEKEKPSLSHMKQLLDGVDRNGFILAVDGDQWVGLAMIIKESTDCCYNSMTGVHRHYRGNGLGTALKVKAIEYAQRIHTRYIRTHNNSNNAAMLAINETLGYENKPGMYTLLHRIF